MKVTKTTFSVQNILKNRTLYLWPPKMKIQNILYSAISDFKDATKYSKGLVHDRRMSGIHGLELQNNIVGIFLNIGKKPKHEDVI